jgi:hypothetical protein
MRRRRLIVVVQQLFLVEPQRVGNELRARVVAAGAACGICVRFVGSVRSAVAVLFAIGEARRRARRRDTAGDGRPRVRRWRAHAAEVVDRCKVDPHGAVAIDVLVYPCEREIGERGAADTGAANPTLKLSKTDALSIVRHCDVLDHFLHRARERPSRRLNKLLAEAEHDVVVERRRRRRLRGERGGGRVD